MESGREALRLRGHQGIVWSCAASPDGRFVASASDDRTVVLWDIMSGQPIHTLRGHERGVLGCAIAPDNKSVISVDKDGMIKVWDVGRGICLNSVQAEGLLCRCSWFTDGSRVLVWGSAGLYFLELMK